MQMREAQRKTNATTNSQKKPSVNGDTSWILPRQSLSALLELEPKHRF